MYKHKTKASNSFQLAATRRRLAISSVTFKIGRLVSTRSHAKAAGFVIRKRFFRRLVSTRSHAKAAGSSCCLFSFVSDGFQLAATRRRLVGYRAGPREPLAVSTRSHAKAAGFYEHGFTLPTIMFQLAATRRRLAVYRS